MDFEALAAHLDSADVATRRSAEEEASKLQYETLSVEDSRKLLLAALRVESPKGRSFLATAACADHALVDEFERLFAAGHPWPQASILQKLSAAGARDALLRCLPDFHPTATLSSVRIFGNPSGIADFAEEIFELKVDPLLDVPVCELGADLGLRGLLREKSRAAFSRKLEGVLRARLPELEAVQCDQPFFWWNRSGYSDRASELTTLLQTATYAAFGSLGALVGRALDFQDPYVRWAAVKTFFALGHSPGDPTLAKTASFSATRYELVAFLKERHLDRLQSEWVEPASFAEAHLANWLSSPWEMERAPSEIQLREHRISEGRHVFVFRYAYTEERWSGSRDPQIALIGPYDFANGIGPTAPVLLGTETAIDLAATEAAIGGMFRQ